MTSAPMEVEVISGYTKHANTQRAGTCGWAGPTRACPTGGVLNFANKGIGEWVRKVGMFREEQQKRRRLAKSMTYDGMSWQGRHRMHETQQIETDVLRQLS